MQESVHQSANLKRSVSTPLLALYGIGTILGAGIYALIGKVTAAAGVYAPLAFLLASFPAVFTGTSFAEFASRFPRAGGEAVYISEGFNNRRLSLLVGGFIIFAGVVSSGVLIRSFVGYAQHFMGMPSIFWILALSLTLGGLAIWGISESLIAIAAVTVIEAAALIFIIAMGTSSGTAVENAIGTAAPAIPLIGILMGGVLAFYAYIGFEDMVDIVEEVKEPHKTMPRAIFISICVTSLIYLAVAWVAIRAVPIADLAQSEAPMALIFTTITHLPGEWIGVIAMFAVANGALVQVVMASRVIYALSSQKQIPAFIGHVNRHTQTPIRATVLIVILNIMATVFPLETLAETTSFLLLTLFTLVNAALLRVKADPAETYDGYTAPVWMTWIALFSSAAFALVSLVAIFT